MIEKNFLQYQLAKPWSGIFKKHILLLLCFAPCLICCQVEICQQRWKNPNRHLEVVKEVDKTSVNLACQIPPIFTKNKLDIESYFSSHMILKVICLQNSTVSRKHFLKSQSNCGWYSLSMSQTRYFRFTYVQCQQYYR